MQFFLIFLITIVCKNLRKVKISSVKICLLVEQWFDKFFYNKCFFDYINRLSDTGYKQNLYNLLYIVIKMNLLQT